MTQHDVHASAEAVSSHGFEDCGVSSVGVAQPSPARRIGRRAVFAAGAGLAALPLIGRTARAAGMQTVMKSNYDVFTVLASDARFSTFVGLLQQSGLAPAARGATPFTVFVPTNTAFNKYPTYIQTLMPNGAGAFPDTTKLVEYIRRHAVVGLHPPSEFEGKTVTLSTVSGVSIVVDGTGSGAPVVTYHLPDNQTVSAHLIAEPIMCSNGLIYPIDDPILR